MTRKSSTTSGELFIGKSGQLDLAEKHAGQSSPDTPLQNEEFVRRLREQLSPAVPDQRNLDAIIALSVPPHFTACANPFQGEAIASAVSTTQADTSRQDPFAGDVAESKADGIYYAHSYHTKVPPRAITQYLLWFTRPGDVILDAYAGSGMTGVAAQLAAEPPGDLKQEIEATWRSSGREPPSWGPRTVCLSDISPAAAFIAYNHNHSVNASRVEREIHTALDAVRAACGHLYETAHSGWPAGERDRSKWKNRRPAQKNAVGNIVLVIWSEVFSCPECGAEIVLWRDAIDSESANIVDDIVCRQCQATASKSGLGRKEETSWDPYLGTAVTQNKFVPSLILYEFNGKRFEKIPDEEDLRLIAESSNLRCEGAPVVRMMNAEGAWGSMFRAGYHRGITHVHHFFTSRNFFTLSQLWNRTTSSEGRFVLTGMMARMSKMHALHLKKFFKGGGGFAAGNRKGQLYIPSLSLELSPLAFLPERLAAAKPAFSVGRPSMSGRVFVGVTPAQRLSLPDASVDYVFVDPPFGQNIIYSELNFLWEAWLGVFTDNVREAIVDDHRGKTLADYQVMMKEGFAELLRVLKPGRWLTVVFHNSRNDVWIAIQEALQQAGFVVADVRVLDKGQKSQKQVVAPGTVRSDLAISAYRPTIAVESLAVQSSPSSVWTFVAEHLGRLPVYVGTENACDVLPERQPHMLFDRMVAFHVQREVAVPVNASEFYEGLRQRLSERDGMYFLPSQVSEYDRKRMRAAELRQLALFVTDEATAIQWLRQQLSSKPQTFQDLQPTFMRELQAWAKHESTVELKVILEQNFLCYDGRGPVPSQIHSYLSTNFKEMRNQGKESAVLVEKARERWYVPDPSKQADLEKLREKTLLKEFSDYVTSKQRKLKQFRTEAIRAGFKAAYEGRDYRTIVSVGAKLPDAVLQEDEKLLMYHDVASMRLGKE